MKHNKNNDTKTNTKKTTKGTLGKQLIFGLIILIAIIFGLIMYNMYNNNNTTIVNNTDSPLTNNIHIPLHNFLTSLADDNIIKDPTIIQKINSSVSVNQSLPHDKFSIGEHIYIRFLKQPFI
tara:strand:- start:211 stop:576 length:366 start_codon:yes stop_codon:yes gene_type:complete